MTKSAVNHHSSSIEANRANREKVFNKVILVFFCLCALILSHFSNATERNLSAKSFGLIASQGKTRLALKQSLLDKNSPSTNNEFSEAFYNTFDNAKPITPLQTRSQIQTYLNALAKPHINKQSARNLKSFEYGYANEHSADFSIFEAKSRLNDDFDYDGYYQTFTVTFDADVYSYTSSQHREVYGILYLSYDGGAWEHYFTTDNFIITSDSEEDAFEVSTTLLSSYSTGHYDVLIDLYQVGFSEPVATLSSEETNALYGLSLESQEYDLPYEEVYVEKIIIVETSAGSFSFLSLSFVCFILLIREKLKSNCCKSKN
jgi:hypothetical protein